MFTDNIELHISNVHMQNEHVLYIMVGIERQRRRSKYCIINKVNLLEWIHSKCNIHAWTVGQEQCKSCLFKKAKDEDFVPSASNINGNISLFFPCSMSECSTAFVYIKSEIFVYVPHSLLYNGINSGLTDDCVGHLDNHNGDEVGSVASVLQYFSVLVRLQQRYSISLNVNIVSFVIYRHQLSLVIRTHCWPQLSSRSLQFLSSQFMRSPTRNNGINPFSARTTKQVKNPATACIIPRKEKKGNK